MYPRLKLARNLLRDDGVIFISIDDNEVHNLRKVCDEIFGEDNFIGEFVINTTPNGMDYGHLAVQHEYTLFYAKNKDATQTNLLPNDNVSFKFNDEVSGFNIHPLYNSNEAFHSMNRPNLFYPFYLDPESKNSDGFYIIDLEKHDGWLIIYPPLSQRNSIQFVWRWGRKLASDNLNKEIIGYLNEDGVYRIVQKMRHSAKLIRSLMLDKSITSRKGTAEVEHIFDSKLFSFPKSISLLYKYLYVATNNNDIILDFFSGSATTAHAVMQLNADDNGNRKYICVQLPEATKPDSEAYKAGYKNICSIGKERIRRAGDKILNEYTAKQPTPDLLSINNAPPVIPAEAGIQATIQLDIGFKVFKLDTSNFKPFAKSDLFSDNLIVDDRTPLDLFYELILKQGYNLDYPQTIIDIGGTKCYALLNSQNAPFILAVLDDTVTQKFALELFKYALTLVIIKDSCFENDEIKLNTVATIEQLESKDNPIQIRIV